MAGNESVGQSAAGVEGPGPEPRIVNSADLAEALRSGSVNLGELQRDAVRFASRLVTDPREQLAKERLFRRGEVEGPHAVGAWVRLGGLQTAALNGRTGVIVAPLSAAGRVGVAITGAGDKAIKTCNLSPFPEAETMKVARLFCRGEKRSGARTWRWPLQYIADRPYQVSPISQRIGLPLHVTRWEPDRSLQTAEDLDSVWVGHLMMDPKTARIPYDWHRMPGPVIVWRADGGDFSADDLCLVVCYIDQLLPRYDDTASPFDADKEVTPDAFQRYKAEELQAASDDSERDKWWEDINI